MLLSLLLSLTPLSPTPLDYFYGREAQAWLLGQIARYDTDLSDSLHQNNTPRPYTISSLRRFANDVHDTGGSVPGADRDKLLPGEQGCLRITSLTNQLSELLLEKILPNLPATLELKWLKFKTLGLVQADGWDGRASFADLVQRGNRARTSASATLEFASPTAFRSSGVDLTLPVAEQVWRSLWRRWNCFAPPELQIDPLWPDFAASCLVVSDFSLRSQKVSFKQGAKGAATGCTGQATYTLLPEKHCGEFAPFRSGAGQVLQTLAAFALYSGVGHHTTIGLGQSRQVER